MTPSMKAWIDEKNAPSIRNAFCVDLSSDPLLISREEERSLCGDWLFEPHSEESPVHPLKKETSEWTEDYWKIVVADLKKNFSKERFSHALEIAGIAVPEKIEAVRQAEDERQAEAARKAREEDERQAEAKLKAREESAKKARLEQQQNPLQPTRLIYPGGESAKKERQAAERRRMARRVIVVLILLGILLYFLLRK